MPTLDPEPGSLIDAEFDEAEPAPAKTPALYLILDRTWWTVHQPLVGGPATWWPEVVEGTLAFAAANPNVLLALQYEPLLGGAYSSPAVEFTLLADLIRQSLHAAPPPSVQMADALPGALQGALDFLAAAPTGRAYGIVVLTRTLKPSSLGFVLGRLRITTVPVFLIAAHNQQPDNDRSLELVAQAQVATSTPYWTATATDVTQALLAIRERLVS